MNLLKTLAAAVALTGVGGATTHAAILINEFVADHTGADSHEYVEIFGDASTDFSSYSVVQIEGEGTAVGLVDSVTPVGTTDASGFWVSAYTSATFENGTKTYLLVQNFTGAVGNDLDTNNDGTFDSTPWGSLADSVAIRDTTTTTEITYGSTVLTPTFDGGTFTVGGASRIPNATDTDTAADWKRNDFDGYGLPGFTGTADAGEAANTPGTTNALVPEPTSLAAIGLGTICLLRRRRTR